QQVDQGLEWFSRQLGDFQGLQIIRHQCVLKARCTISRNADVLAARPAVVRRSTAFVSARPAVVRARPIVARPRPALCECKDSPALLDSPEYSPAARVLN